MANEIANLQLNGVNRTIKDANSRQRLDTIEEAIANGDIGGKVKDISEETETFPLIEVDDMSDDIAGKYNKTIADLGTWMLQREHQYKVGQVAYSPELPSWARLKCVQAGTTDSEKLDISNMTELDEVDNTMDELSNYTNDQLSQFTHNELNKGI